MMITNFDLSIAIGIQTALILFYCYYHIKKQVKKQIKEDVTVMTDNVVMIKDAINYVNSSWENKMKYRHDISQEPDDAA